MCKKKAPYGVGIRKCGVVRNANGVNALRARYCKEKVRIVRN